MKALFLILLSTILLPESVMAKKKYEPLPSDVKRVPSGVPCQESAEKVAKVIDEIAHGRERVGSMKTTSTNEGSDYSFKITFHYPNDASSITTYEIALTRDYRSQACIIGSVSVQ